jgi:hypothetical protein
VAGWGERSNPSRAPRMVALLRLRIPVQMARPHEPHPARFARHPPLQGPFGEGFPACPQLSTTFTAPCAGSRNSCRSRVIDRAVDVACNNRGGSNEFSKLANLSPAQSISRGHAATSSKAAAAHAGACEWRRAISNFPTAGMWTCRLTPVEPRAARLRGGWSGSIDAERASPIANRASQVPRPCELRNRGCSPLDKKFFAARGNEPLAHALRGLTPGGVPPSPQPLTHPAIDPGPFGRRGLLFFEGAETKGHSWRNRSSRRNWKARRIFPNWGRHRVGGTSPD